MDNALDEVKTQGAGAPQAAEEARVDQPVFTPEQEKRIREIIEESLVSLGRRIRVWARA